MTDVNSFIAIAIEGIGQEGDISGGYQSDGILWATTGVRQHVDLLETDTDWDWRASLDINSLGGTDTLIEPFRSEARWSSYGFQLDAASDELAERLLYEQRRADGALDATSISPTDTSIPTDVDDGSLANKTIYINDETILLGPHGGGGIYPAVERGAYGSTAQTHREGANIFTSTPFWDGRRVILYTVEHTGGPDLEAGGGAAASLEFEERWRGRLDAGIEQNKGRMRVRCLEMGAGLDSVQGGREERLIDDAQGVYLFSQQSQTINVRSFGLSDDYEPKALKPDAAETTVRGTTNAVDIDGEVFAASAQLNAAGDAYARSFIVDVEQPQFERTLDSDKLGDNKSDQPISDDDCFEVVAASRLENTKICPVAAVERALGSSNPLRKTNLWSWHPLTYWACLMLSTKSEDADGSIFDVFQSDWSLNLKWLFADGIVDDIKALIQETPWMKIDRAVLGMGGEPVDLWRRANEMFLTPWGFYLGLDNNGNLTIHRIRTVDIEDYDEATRNQISPSSLDVLSYKTGRQNTTDVIDCNLGGTGPAEGSRLLIKARDDASDRAGDLKSDSSISLNLETVSPKRYRYAINTLTARALLQHFAIPRIRFKAADHLDDGLDYGLGKSVQIDALNVEPAWIVDKLGDRVSDLSEDDRFFTGFLIGRKFMATGDGAAQSYELEMLMHGDTLTRWRAPSGVVQSSTVQSPNARINLGGEGGSDSAFGDTQKDASRFTVGDEIVIRDEDGSDWVNSQIAEVTNVDVSGSNNFIDVDNDFGGNAPPAGKIVELAHLDSDGSGTGYANSGALLSAISRAYVYLADDSDTLGDANLDADEYGA